MHKILFVDDEPSICETSERFLTANGFSVRTAQDGREALEIAHFWSPDLIVLDILLPKINGLVVCELLRRDPATRGIPVLCISSVNQSPMWQEALITGANAYIRKPFDFEELLTHVNHLLKVPLPT